MLYNLKRMFAGCTDIVFIHKPVYGFILLIILLAAPALGVAGILCLFSARACGRLLGADKKILFDPIHLYNPLLVGLSLGYRFETGLLLLGLVVVSGVLTFIVTALLAQMLVSRLRLPLLSLPFVVVSSLVYLAACRYPGLRATDPSPVFTWLPALDLPLWISGYFRAIGGVFFLPEVWAGAVLAGLILLHSRILFTFSLAGFLAGVAVRAFLTGSPETAFSSPDNFNFPLVSMALGAIFLVPSPGSCAVALLGVMSSAVLADGLGARWEEFGIPLFALPFNLTVLPIVFFLMLINHPRLVTQPGNTPENTLENHIRMWGRPQQGLGRIRPPFAGAWTVWQAVGGSWTHQGLWRHAFDFVITDEAGKAFKGTGGSLKDYYAFGKPVLAPIEGRVVKVIRKVPDNPIGATNKAYNWGNLVIIQSPLGFCVEISHFAANSIRVAEGAWVKSGAVLGLCGNSGFSPLPHIHIQVQATGHIGAPTVPFLFTGCMMENRYCFNSLPKQGETVQSLLPDSRTKHFSNLVPGRSLRFKVVTSKKRIIKIKAEIGIDGGGETFLKTSRGCLYFVNEGDMLRFFRITGRDPCLSLLFQVLPSLPLCTRPGMEWSDHLPLSRVVPRAIRPLVAFLAILKPELFRCETCHKYITHGYIQSTIRWKLFGWKRSLDVKIY